MRGKTKCLFEIRAKSDIENIRIHFNRFVPLFWRFISENLYLMERKDGRKKSEMITFFSIYFQFKRLLKIFSFTITGNSVSKCHFQTYLCKPKRNVWKNQYHYRNLKFKYLVRKNWVFLGGKRKISFISANEWD